MSINKNAQIIEQITTSKESVSLGTWITGITGQLLNPEPDNYLLQRVYILLERLSPDDQQNIFKICQRILYDYDFSEVTLENTEEQPLFALTMAQAWLANNLPLPGKNAGLISAISLMLPKQSVIHFPENDVSIPNGITYYKFKPKKISEQVSFSDRFNTFPLLVNAGRVSPVARRLLINMGVYGANLVPVYPGTKALILQGYDELHQAGLLTPWELSLADELDLLTLYELRPFAEAKNLPSIPRRKSDLISALVAHCDHRALRGLVSKNRKRSSSPQPTLWYRPNIKGSKSFRDIMNDELGILEKFLFSIVATFPNIMNSIYQPGCRWRTGHGQFSRPGDQIRKDFDHQKIADNPYMPQEGDDSYISSEEELIVRSFWIQEYSQIIDKVMAKKPRYYDVADAALAITQSLGQRKVLKQCQEAVDSKAIRKSWQDVLENFIYIEMLKRTHFPGKDRELVCQGCGVHFLEWSVPLTWAHDVGNNVVFCSKCYDEIFDYGTVHNTSEMAALTDQELLNRLFQLGEAMGSLPLRDKAFHPKLPADSVEAQVRVGKAFLRLPSYYIYLERFGDWMSALLLSGLLVSGHQRTSRGINCLAKDGHLCLSLGEKVIDDWLTDSGIAHDKEVYYPLDEQFNPNELSRADWKVGSTFIEYAGMMDDPEYAKKMKRKESLCVALGFQLIVLEPKDLAHLDEYISMIITPQHKD